MWKLLFFGIISISALLQINPVTTDCTDPVINDGCIAACSTDAMAANCTDAADATSKPTCTCCPTVVLPEGCTPDDNDGDCKCDADYTAHECLQDKFCGCFCTKPGNGVGGIGGDKHTFEGNSTTNTTNF